MAIIGNTDLWADLFPDSLLPEILNMVVEVWSSFTKPTSDDLEVPITKRFRTSLEQYKDLKMLPIRIDREVPVDNLEASQELGRIDLRLTHGYRSDVYFAFECKRLNVMNKSGRINSLAKDYVTSGMLRFVSTNPQYARNLAQGGMIAYVMNGNTTTAITSVNKQIKKYCFDLHMEPTDALRISSKLSKSLVKESLHNLPHQSFTLHHIFLPV